MTDDEQLMRMAALAAGIELAYPSGMPIWKAGGGIWDPLNDDIQALRLAAALEMRIGIGSASLYHGCMFGEDVMQGEMRATRRAIVRAAASKVKPQP